MIKHMYQCLSLLLAIVLCAAPVLVSGSPCTDACDATEPAPIQADMGTFCGIDGATYTTTMEKFRTNYCYSYCGVAARYAGACGCPNDCGSHVEQGACVVVNASVRRCECVAGFGGVDCMSVNCSSGNTCSGHGACVSTASVGDTCECNDGYTGPYCSQAVFSYPLYDPVVPDVPPLLQPGYEYVTDVLNLSVMGHLRISIDPSDFDYIINPFTVYNASREAKNATVFYSNGNVKVEQLPATLSVKGATSRLDLKKGWKLSFPNQDKRFFGLKQIGLKTGNGGNDSCMKPFIMSSLARTLGLMLPRPAMTVVYINDVLMGVYFFDEAPDDPSFLNAVFGGSSGPSVKLTFAAFMKFEGWNISTYRDQGDPIFGGGVLNYIETDDWTSYIDLVNSINLPNMDPSTLVDVNAMLRTVALEAFAVDDDHFLAGNNYFLYQPKTDAPWVIIDHDFDTEFAPKHGNPVPLNPLLYPLDGTLNGGNNLVLTVFANADYFEQYADVVIRLAKSPALAIPNVPTMLSATDEVEPLQTVYARFGSFLYPWIRADRLQQFAFNTTPQSFNATVATTCVELTTRSAYVVSTMEGTPASNNKTLTDVEIGAIAGGGTLLVIIVVSVVLYRRAVHRRRTAQYEEVLGKETHYLT